MKKSASISLAIVAACGITARAQQRQDPCGAGTFNEQACQPAVQNRGYGWNSRWVRMKYRAPYPYYYDAHQEYLASGGEVSEAIVGSCGPSHWLWFGTGGHRGEQTAHRGFGSTGSRHAAHG